MKFRPDFATNSRKEWVVSLFQSNLRKQIVNCRKFWNLWKLFIIVHYYSFDSLARPWLAPGPRAWPARRGPGRAPAWAAARRPRPAGPSCRLPRPASYLGCTVGKRQTILYFPPQVVIFQTDLLLKFWDCSGAEVYKLCNIWKMQSNAYFLAKFRFDTAENEPAKNLPNFRKTTLRVESQIS